MFWGGGGENKVLVNYDSRIIFWPLLTINADYWRVSDKYSYFSRKTYCGYPLEAPYWGTSKGYLQHFFFWGKIRKLLVHFDCKKAKSGLKGKTLYWLKIHAILLICAIWFKIRYFSLCLDNIGFYWTIWLIANDCQIDQHPFFTAR